MASKRITQASICADVLAGHRVGPQSRPRAESNAPANETQLLFAIRDALLATQRVLLWRNNTGRLQDTRGRWVQYGLGLGSPDLVGILRDMWIGGETTYRGRFLAVEVKMPGKVPEVHQASWHAAARDAGALVIVAHSVEEALAGLPPAHEEIR